MSAAPLSEAELADLVGSARRDAQEARRAEALASLALRLAAEVKRQRERELAWQRATGCTSPEDFATAGGGKP